MLTSHGVDEETTRTIDDLQQTVSAHCQTVFICTVTLYFRLLILVQRVMWWQF